jgi:N-dimethylarginine dimethylaminohydrolase
MTNKALLCRPTYFKVVDSKNVHMTQLVPVDTAGAYTQWEALCDALKGCGVSIELIDPIPDLEDMVFAANQAFVGFHEVLGKFIVPSHMVHSSRQREVPFYVDWFSRNGYRILDLDLGNEFLEGHGDLLWHPYRPRIYGGYGFRTTQRGLEVFRVAMDELGFDVVPLELVADHFYHLDACLTPLNGEAALVYPGAFSSESLNRLYSSWERIHELTEEEALRFMANGIVANGHYITPHLTPHLEDILSQEKLIPTRVNTSEFEKSGGSAFCMKTFLY